MSEYEFGYDPTDGTSDLGETGASQQGPKWFRDGLDKLSSQVQELKAENDRLKAQQVRADIEGALRAKGFDPAAAGLYAGEPAKLDDWLTAHGGALAKLPIEGQEQGAVTPQGPPASTVPATDQAQMQRMQEAGAQGALPPQGSEAELVQRLKNAATPAEFDEIMRANGSPHSWT